MVTSLVLHLGGIDEIGIFVVPAVVALLALRWVDKRAKVREDAERAAEESTAE